MLLIACSILVIVSLVAFGSTCRINPPAAITELSVYTNTPKDTAEGTCSLAAK